MRLTNVLQRTFNTCFTYGKRALHILLCIWIIPDTNELENYGQGHKASLSIHMN